MIRVKFKRVKDLTEGESELKKQKKQKNTEVASMAGSRNTKKCSILGLAKEKSVLSPRDAEVQNGYQNPKITDILKGLPWQEMSSGVEVCGQPGVSLRGSQGNRHPPLSFHPPCSYPCSPLAKPNQKSKGREAY